MLHDARVANLLALKNSTPEAPEVLRALAQAYNARSMPEQALATCEELLTLDPDHEGAWYELVIATAEIGTMEPLLARLEELADECGGAAWYHRTLGLIHYHLEDDDEAREACKRALSLDPEDGRSHEVLAYLAFTVGDLDAAVEEGIKAVEQDGDNFRALHWLGHCYSRLGARDQAIRYFQRALRIEDGYFFALESLGSLYLEDETSFPMALQCYARILSVNPRFFPAYFQLADALIQVERFTEAAAQAKLVLSLDPDASAEADAQQYLGLIRLMQGRLEEAAELFERALALDENFAAAHHYLGVTHERDGNAEAAEACYRKAIEKDPEYSNPRVRLGYVCFDRKEYESAKRHFDDALEIEPDDHLAHLGLGELAHWRKEYSEQLEHCERAAELAPDDSNVQNQLGIAHDALGDGLAAADHYRRALLLDPHNRQAANNLGHLFERLLENAPEDQAGDIREMAIGAWKQRLLICRDTGASLKAAREHLETLGVETDTVEEWLLHGQLE
ncbi:MAG: tetratricopeptide repeat protein [Acidobacteriota bacterium]